MSQKTALITGATSGIGLGIARSLAADGVHIAINGRNQDEAALIAADLAQTFNIQAIPACGDLAEDGIAEKLVAQVEQDLGAIDILVNNAGVQYVAPIEDFPAERWQHILNLNLGAAFYLSKAVIAGMKQRKWGRIINIASAHGLVASPFKAAYVSAKHGLVGLTKVIALETAEDGVTCNAICPGYVMTPLVENQIENQAKSHGIPKETVIRDVILAPQPNKTFAQVEELGALCVFLCSEQARSITGAALPMDGGWTAK